MSQCAGIVLCGGQSKRMGTPKPWLPIAGELLLPRVVRILSEAVDPIVIVAAGTQDLPALPANVQVVRDERDGRGPLQGLAAGLAALKGQAGAAFVSSCDVPFLLPAFVQRMIELHAAHSICVPFIDGFSHPLAAVYRIEVLEAVRELLAENRLRVVDLFDRVPTRFVTADELRDVDPTLESLRNLNTPEDYERAVRDSGS